MFVFGSLITWSNLVPPPPLSIISLFSSRWVIAWGGGCGICVCVCVRREMLFCQQLAIKRHSALNAFTPTGNRQQVSVVPPQQLQVRQLCHVPHQLVSPTIVSATTIYLNYQLLQVL